MDCATHHPKLPSEGLESGALECHNCRFVVHECLHHAVCASAIQPLTVAVVRWLGYAKGVSLGYGCTDRFLTPEAQAECNIAPLTGNFFTRAFHDDERHCYRLPGHRFFH